MRGIAQHQNQDCACVWERVRCVCANYLSKIQNLSFEVQTCTLTDTPKIAKKLVLIGTVTVSIVKISKESSDVGI